MLEDNSATFDYRGESYLVTAYFAAYMVYLFLRPESELAHWLTLVVIPFGLLDAHQRWKVQGWSLGQALATVGFRRGNLSSGLAWAIPVGLIVQDVIGLILWIRYPVGTSF